MGGLVDDGRALCTILHMKARVRGACSERSDTMYRAFIFCQLRMAWLCISCVLCGAQIPSIQQGLSYYLHYHDGHSYCAVPWPGLFNHQVITFPGHLVKISSGIKWFQVRGSSSIYVMQATWMRSE